MNAYQALLEDDKIEASTPGFKELREQIASPEFFEKQKSRDSYGLKYLYIKLEESKVVVHAEETGTPSNVNYGIDVRRDLKSVDETLERNLEKTFLNYGVLLLATGFVLQIIDALLIG